MMNEDKKGSKRYGVIAACGILGLAVIFGAYQIGRSAGPGKDIGEETAKSVALGHAEVAENALSRYEIAREERDGASVYEVKFAVDGVAYDYEVSAATGSIVKFSREANDAASEDLAAGAPAPEDEQIGEARAWEIAFDHAGITGDPAAGEPAKLDYDDGVLVYELEFFSDGYEYDYEINAADGSVVKFEREADTRSVSTQPVQTPAASSPAPSVQTPAASSPVPSVETPAKTPAGSGDISEAQAKEIALKHAGVAADSISNYKWKLDFDDGMSVYELEFTSGGYEYEYEVSTADGSIVKFEKEAIAAYTASQAGQSAADTTSVYIGEARAQEIAYSHASLTADAVIHCGVELDHHGSHHGNHHHRSGCCTYEVDFRSGGYEYEYKIDATTGEILEFQQERED